MALVPRLVERPFLQRAHARTDGTDAAASTVGPALGGLLVSALGAPVAVLLDAATYVYSAITLRRIELVEPVSKRRGGGGSLVGEILHGLRWIYRGSGLAGLAVATHGAIVGASITTRVGLLLGTGRTIIVCHVISAAGALVMIAAGIAITGWASVMVLAAGELLYGLAMGMSNSHEMSYRQLVTPDELQARTNTTMRSLNRAVMVVVAPLAGVMADGWGMAPTLLTAALVFGLVAAGLAATSFRTVRAPT